MEGEQQFHFPDGTSVSSVDALRDKIETISYDVFYHHVSDSKNDFANWVYDVFSDKKLAEQMNNVRDKVHSQVIILRSLVKKL